MYGGLLLYLVGFRGKYLGGGWAVKVPEGQVRRRVVGEGVGDEVVFDFLEGGVGKKREF